MATATLTDKRVQELVEELCHTIKHHFPEVEFAVYEGDDPKGIYIDAYANIETVWDMLPLVSARMAEIVEDEGVIIGVLPLRKKEERHAVGQD